MDEIKFIISKLNESPFNKNLNLISYDNLSSEQKIQILFEIFKAIDETVNINIVQLSDVEELVMKILEMLRILKYNPPSNINPTALINGESKIMNNIYYYLLRKLPELKERAYLAKFLVKIQVSPDVEGDQDIVQLYEKYEKLIENFKSVHSSYVALKQNLDSVQDLQKDVKAMEEEKNQIQEKLANVKRKVDNDKDSRLFDLIAKYKKAKEKEETTTRQINQQDLELKNICSKIDTLKNRSNESRSMLSMGNNCEEILDKLEEEIEAKKHLIEQVLPQELNSLENYIKEMQLIDSQPMLAADYLSDVKKKIQSLSKEINTIIEKKMLQPDNDDDEDDKLILARQNASLAAEKRKNYQQKVEEALEKLEEDKKKLEIKKKEFNCDQLLQGEELKNFMQDIRMKSINFKQKKQELDNIREEIGKMIKSESELRDKIADLEENLIKLEEQKGIAGYFSSSINDSKIIENEQKGSNKESIKSIIDDLNDKISSKKAQLAPLVKELRPLRQQVNELQVNHDQKKSKYDSLAADIESDINKTELMVKKLRNEVNILSSNKFSMQIELQILSVKSELIELEKDLIASSDAIEKDKSLRLKIEKQIKLEIDKKDFLKIRLKSLLNNELCDKRQLKMWKDLQELMKMKKKCFEKRKLYTENVDSKENHLIL